MSALDEALARLAEIRIEIERHEAMVWCLQAEQAELRQRVRVLNAPKQNAA
jgi:hypothetical protein